MEITICKEELKIREYDRYRAFYRGISFALRQRLGIGSREVLSESLTGLAVLLYSVSGETPMNLRKNSLLPVQKQDVFYGTATEYTADMLILLHDILYEARAKRKRTTGKAALTRELTERAYPGKAKEMRRAAEELFALEEEDETVIDKVSGAYGRLIAAIFRRNEEDPSEDLYDLGFYFGKFYYLLSSLETLREDLAAKRYNIWRHYLPRRDFEALTENALLYVIAEAAEVFRRLAVGEDEDILQNILYEGVWEPFRKLQKSAPEEKKGLMRFLPVSVSKGRKKTASALNGRVAELPVLSAAEYYAVSRTEYEKGNNLLAYRYAGKAHDTDPEERRYRDWLLRMQEHVTAYRACQVRKV